MFFFSICLVGINSVREAFRRVNDRLPHHLRINNPTGHSGRHSFASASISAGTDSTVVSLSTKHKTNAALKRYIHREDSTKIQPALKIARQVVADGLLVDDNDQVEVYED